MKDKPENVSLDQFAIHLGHTCAFPTTNDGADPGMTLRQAIAKDCMAALIPGDVAKGGLDEYVCANLAVRAADALLLALVSQ